MKKIVIYLILSVAIVSCYDNYVKDFDKNALYFSYQVDVRTFVVGEGMKFDFGVSLGGVIENTKDRVVPYQFDNSLLSAATLTMMQNGANYIKNAMGPVTELKMLPASYYTLSNGSQFVIKSGQHSGTVTVKADSVKFLADAATLNPTYALPLRITSGDADTILLSKNYNVIGVKYENMLFGNYWHGGVTIVKNPAGTVISTSRYYTSPVDNKTWALKTVAPFELTGNGFSDVAAGDKPQMKLSVSGANITISSVPGSTNVILPDGTCTFNQAKLLQNRKIFLSYKYVNTDGNTCYATDTLTFRNRIRDGVNEWQDENPSHY
jgi:hypothetical protein